MDDARYPPNPYSVNHHQQRYVSSQRPKLPMRNTSYSQPIGNEYGDEDDNDQEDEEEEEEEDDGNEERGLQRVDKEAEDDDDDEEADEDENGDDQGDYQQMMEAEESERHRKKRKLKSLGYEFARRVNVPSVTASVASIPKASFGGRNSPADWTEHATFVLLDAWGNRFLQLGRKNLRSEGWQEVAEQVSKTSKTERTDTQCRNRLDTLKKKYKTEKMKLAESGITTSKWVYFKKMDMLMTSSPRQPGLSCGLDSGEYFFMNPKVYLNRSNGLEEMRDSPENSESLEGDGDDSDGLPPKRTRFQEDAGDGSSFKLLADSIKKFGEIYEKIEDTKREQMLELEKMRMEFHRDLELQKRQILEKAQAEIAHIQQGDDEDYVSVENLSG